MWTVRKITSKRWDIYEDGTLALAGFSTLTLANETAALLNQRAPGKLAPISGSLRAIDPRDATQVAGTVANAPAVPSRPVLGLVSAGMEPEFELDAALSVSFAWEGQNHTVPVVNGEAHLGLADLDPGSYSFAANGSDPVTFTVSAPTAVLRTDASFVLATDNSKLLRSA